MTPELNMLYVHSDAMGYGRMGVEVARNLTELGVNVFDHLPDPTQDTAMAHLNEGRNSGICNTVAWFSVPGHARGWYKGQHTVILTMWESQTLPPSFREHLHEFDQVIVPSWQNLDLFGQYHPNVKFVPLGVDPVRWHYRKRKPPETQFRFLIGGSGPRKGTDLAYKAFRKVFATWPADMPVPVLVMKNPRGEDFYGDRIEMVTGRLSADAEVDLYANAHCYLQPSRGEGFGLQPLQAIAQGLPTILTAAHGHDSFVHLGYGLSAEHAPAAYFIYGDAGEWWEPNFDELCQYMEYVYYHWEDAAAGAEVASKAALEEFTWRRTAERFIDAVGRDQLTTPYRGDGSWYTPEVKRFLVRVNKPWRADIAGVTYQFQPGNDYHELADVKRILFEAGLLDPSCLADGDGLTPEQCERLGDYSAAHSHCFACGQRLGSQPTRADELMGVS